MAGSEPGTHRAGARAKAAPGPHPLEAGSSHSLGEKQQKSVLTLSPVPGPREFSRGFRMFAFLVGLGPCGFSLAAVAEPVERTGRSCDITQAAPHPPSASDSVTRHGVASRRLTE